MLLSLQYPLQDATPEVRLQLVWTADGLPFPAPTFLQEARTASSGLPLTSTINLGFSQVFPIGLPSIV